MCPIFLNFSQLIASPQAMKKSLYLTNTIPSTIKTDKSPATSNTSTSNLWTPNLQTFNPNPPILLRELVIDTEL